MAEAQTTMMTIREGAINPLTGHMYTNDDVATFRTLQPDRPDPLTQPFPGCRFPVQSAEIPGGGNPGIPGGVPPGGGGGGRGGRGHPGVPAVAAGQNPGDKLIGNLLSTFTGDRTKSETFMSNWKKYCRANKDTT